MHEHIYYNHVLFNSLFAMLDYQDTIDFLIVNSNR